MVQVENETRDTIMSDSSSLLSRAAATLDLKVRVSRPILFTVLVPTHRRPPPALQEYASGFVGRAKIDRLLFIAQQCKGDDSIPAAAAALARDEIKAQTLDAGIYKVLLENHAVGTEDVDWIERCESTYFAKQSDVETRMTAAKTALDSKGIASLEAEFGDLLVEKGLGSEAMKHYLRMREYSREMDDLLTMTHRAALCAFHSKNYFGVINHVRKLEAIPEATSIDPLVVSRLRLLGSLTQVICQKFDVGARMSMKVGQDALMTSADIVSPAAYSLAIILSAVASLNREELKKMNDSPSFQPVLDAAPRDLRSFFAAVLSARYGEALALLESEIKPKVWIDMAVGPHLGVLYEKIHDRCLREYSAAFSLIDLASMSELFSIPVPDLESRLAGLIQSDRLKARIDLQRHRLVVDEATSRAKAYEIAMDSANSVIEDSNLIRLRSQVLRHGLSKPSKNKEGIGAGFDLGPHAIDNDNGDVGDLGDYDDMEGTMDAGLHTGYDDGFGGSDGFGEEVGH